MRSIGGLVIVTAVGACWGEQAGPAPPRPTTAAIAAPHDDAPGDCPRGTTKHTRPLDPEWRPEGIATWCETAQGVIDGPWEYNHTVPGTVEIIRGRYRNGKMHATWTETLDYHGRSSSITIEYADGAMVLPAGATLPTAIDVAGDRQEHVECTSWSPERRVHCDDLFKRYAMCSLRSSARAIKECQSRVVRSVY